MTSWRNGVMGNERPTGFDMTKTPKQGTQDYVSISVFIGETLGESFWRIVAAGSISVGFGKL